MTLRLQKERMNSGIIPCLDEFVRAYQLDNDRLRLAKPDVIVMHPGPVNEDVELRAAGG